MRLHPAVAASGVKLFTRDKIGSTNSEALTLSRAGEVGPLWVTAQRQSAGRGRRGRSWVSEPGNLYASLLVSDPAPPAQAPQLSFVAGLAVYDAVVAIAPAALTRLALKWPNDLLIDGRKFSGILIEGEGAAVVIGIGANCVHHPKQTAYPTTDLVAAGVSIDAERFFETISITMMTRIEQWNRGLGFDTIRADWLARAGGLGGPVRVDTADGERIGQFITIDEYGRLILKMPNGTMEKITAGDVFVFSGQGRALAAGQ